MDKDILTVRDVAQRLEIGLDSAYCLVKNGIIPSIRIGHQYLVPRLRSEQWLDGEREKEDRHADHAAHAV